MGEGAGVAQDDPCDAQDMEAVEEVGAQAPAYAPLGHPQQSPFIIADVVDSANQLFFLEDQP